MSKKITNAKPGRLRSQDWFDNPSKIDIGRIPPGSPVGQWLEPRGTAIRQAGDRHHPDRLRHYALHPASPRARQAGGVAFEFPIHPIQETLKRLTNDKVGSGSSPAAVKLLRANRERTG